MILAFDTYYFDNSAKTVCLAFENWTDENIMQDYSETIHGIRKSYNSKHHEYIHKKCSGYSIFRGRERIYVHFLPLLPSSRRKREVGGYQVKTERLIPLHVIINKT